MSNRRCTIAELEIILIYRIPEDPNGTPILQTTNPDGSKSGGIKMTPAFIPHLVTLRNEARIAKTYARKTNEGQPNEEMTIKGTVRVCHHDEGEGHRPCEGEIEI